MSCETWFESWLRNHIGKHPKPKWPEYGTPEGDSFYEGYIAAFNGMGMTEAEGFAVSLAMQREKPCFLDGMLHRILEKLDLLREIEAKRSGQSVNGAPTGHEIRECVDCGGTGYARLRPKDPSHPRHRDGVLFYCVCPAGRRTKAKQEEADTKTDDPAQRVAHRIPDLADPRFENLRQDPARMKGFVFSAEAFLSAETESRGCPECSDAKGRPGGMAVRPAIYRPGPPFPMHCNVFCRCPLGRLKAEIHFRSFPPDRLPPEIELQARPDLWNRELSHESWSNEPSHPRFPASPEAEFLPLGDPRLRQAKDRGMAARTLVREVEGVKGVKMLGGGSEDKARQMRREAMSVRLVNLEPPSVSSPSPPPAPSAVPLWSRHADIRAALDERARQILDAAESSWRLMEIFDGIEREGMPTDSDIATVRLRLLSLAAPAKPPAPEPDPDPVPAPAARPSPARRVPAALK